MKLLDIEFPYAKEIGRFDLAWDVEGLIYGPAVSAGYKAFVSDLQKKGAVLYDENRIGPNRFATLTGEDGALSVSFTEYDSTVRLVRNPLTVSVLPPLSDDNFFPLCQPELHVMTLDYSHRDVTDGNGMSYVFTLGDGSYLIYDGGYPQDTDNLYRFLVGHNRRDDGKIVIAAWVFTHSHWDHYGNFRSFREKYADKVKVEYFVANPTSGKYFRMPQYDSFLTVELPKTAKEKFPGSKIVKLTTGQRMAVRDAVIEAYYCQIDHYPDWIDYMNLSSLVTKVHIVGEDILFLADAELHVDDILPKMYGVALKSDIFQVAHHGWSGGNETLFNLIMPEVAMWTTSRAAFDIRITSAWPRATNRYLYNKMPISEYLIADGEVKTLTLPYHPKRGEKVVR